MTLKLKELTLGVALASVSAGALAYSEETGRTGIHNGLGDVADAVSRLDGENDDGPLHPLKNIDGDEPAEAPIESTLVAQAATIDAGFTDNGFPEAPINTVDEGIGAGLTQIAGAIDSELPKAPQELQDAIQPIDDVIPEKEAEPEPQPVGSAGQAGEVAVTVSGNVNDALSCTVGAPTNGDFAFPDMITGTGEVSSSVVSFDVSCSDENNVETDIYLSTNSNDPKLGNGSNVLAVSYTDSDAAESPVDVLVFSGTGSNGTPIGTSSPDTMSDGSGNATTISTTAVSLYATIDTAQLGDGGSISGGGSITVWFD